MNNRSLVLPVDGRRMISTGVGITLVAAGAILRFAVPATFTHGLNLHVVGVIVMLAGVFGLLLSLLLWGPLDRRRNHYGGYGRGRPGSGVPTRTNRQREARRSRDRESALRDSEHRRRHFPVPADELAADGIAGSPRRQRSHMPGERPVSARLPRRRPERNPLPCPLSALLSCPLGAPSLMTARRRSPTATLRPSLDWGRRGRSRGPRVSRAM